MSFLTIKDLSKTYPGRNSPTLNKICFELHRGQSLAVLGLNGHGKTTLLRLIAGHESADSGEIILQGTTLTGPQQFISPQKRPITTMFQELSLFPHLSVKDNILFGIDHLDTEEQRARLTPLAEILQLTPLLNDHPGEISGGQRQRVALARTLIPHPQLVLLDEPFSALDTQSRLTIRGELIQYLKDHHITAIYVLHQQEDAFACSDLALLLDRGEKVECAPLQKLYTDPQDAKTADFMGHWSKIPPHLFSELKEKVGTTFYMRPQALIWEGTRYGAIIKEVFPLATSQKIILHQNHHHFHGFAPLHLNLQKGQEVRFDLDPNHIISFSGNSLS